MAIPKIPDIRINVLSGLTVSLALVPEAIAFALVAHVSPLTGLYAAFMVCLITAIFGGRPGMISGATGALAVVMVALVVQHGVEYLFATVVLMGLLQILFAAFRLGKFIRLVPYPVMLGFVNGLAIVIFLAQFGHFKSIDVNGVVTWLSGSSLYTMIGLIALTMAIIYLLPKLTMIVPSSLAAILAVSALVALTGISTKTVGDMGSIAGGFFATMGGCAMIGQSMININNGAKHRLSGIVAAVCLLGFILFLSHWIELIPLAALIGLMFVVAEKTFEWGSLQALHKIPKEDAVIVIGVTVITVLTDLAIAVLSGVVFAALVFAWNHAKQIRVSTSMNESGWKVYELHGSLFFAACANFQNLFTPKDDPVDVVIEFRHARVVDHSAIEAIDALAIRYQQEGKRLHLRHLSPDCLELLDKAKDMIEVNDHEDPHYHIADNKLG